MDETLEIINKIFNYNKDAQNFFHRASKIDKKVRTKDWKKYAQRTKLRRQKDKEFIKNIENKSKAINNSLFKEYFKFGSPSDLAKQLYKIKNKNKNNELVNVIKSGMIDLKNKINKMSKDEKEIEKPDRILEIVDEIIDFNNKIQEQQEKV